MSKIRKNREFYLAIVDLIASHEKSPRTLSDYLRALLSLAIRHQGKRNLSKDEFLELLTQAFSSLIPEYIESWRSEYDSAGERKTDFEGWQSTIIRQIVDLHEMEQAGMMENELRYFGINSPRGSNWYNFNPCTYLECATVGFYGGWEEGDPRGRRYVSGQVAVLGEDGKIEPRDPKEISHPMIELRHVSWDDFSHFLIAGQLYE